MEVSSGMDVTLDEWVRFIFDHPVTETAWHFDIASPGLTLPATQTATLIAQAFERSGELLRRFTDAQLNQGFWFLVSSGSSDYMFSLLDAAVAWPVRRRALRSFVPLFRDVMAPRCTPSLSHRSEPGSALNSACYMWWDLLPLGGPCEAGRPPEPIHAEALAVLAELLEIPHDACRESALHGLGHLALFHAEAAPIVDAFIERSPDLRRELIAYARQARTGYIL
jgi:hypothetical protein